jgi:hypothetical protein
MHHNSTTDTPEQGRSCRSFDAEPRANLRNLRKNFRAHLSGQTCTRTCLCPLLVEERKRQHQDTGKEGGQGNPGGQWKPRGQAGRGEHKLKSLQMRQTSPNE